jgi:hypothetical protein
MLPNKYLIIKERKNNEHKYFSSCENILAHFTHSNQGLHIIDKPRYQHGQGLKNCQPLLSAHEWQQRYKQTK